MTMNYVDPWNKKLARMRELRDEGKPVWYRRDEFYNDGFTPEDEMPIPKWHVAADRKEAPGGLTGVYTWQALCGYRYKFKEILLDTPKVKLSGKPKIAEQCTRCRNKLLKTQQQLALTHHVTTKVGTTMSDQPTFTGTPDDWWEQAEEIMESEANNRNLGSWYITMVRTAGDTRPGYRLSTPSKPPNTDKLIRDKGPHDKTSPRVRLLVRSVEEVPKWMTALMVIADTVVGDEVVRLPWMRKNNGRWQSLYDGRLNINDHAMAQLLPNPASITEDTTDDVIGHP